MNERKKILFDIDDTILDFRTAEKNAIRQTFEEFSVPVDESVLRRYSEINISLWQRLELGTITREALLVERFETLFRELGISAPAEKVQQRYESLLESGHYFVPGAPQLLEALFPRYDLYLISNGNVTTQNSRLKSAGISSFFKGIFISERVGANKPSKAFFDVCFAAIPGFCPEDALIVGDSLSSDILGGINAGVRTCWFNPSGDSAEGTVRPDYEIHALGELPALIKEIFEE